MSVRSETRGHRAGWKRLDVFPLLPITLLWVGLDLFMRPSLSMHTMQWAWWLGSIAFSLIMWEALFRLSWSLRARARLQKVLVCVASLAASALAVTFVGFHRVFFSWPTAYAGTHVLRHPREAWGYVVDAGSPLYAAAWIGLSLFIAGCWRAGLGREAASRRLLPPLMLGLLLVGGGIGFGAIHRHASAMITDAAGVKLWIDLGVNYAVGGERGRLMLAHRPSATDVYGGPPLGSEAPNVIVIVGESVAPQHMELYGYGLPTTPRLSELRNERREDWVQFARAIANGSATKVALPSMMTGLFPSREPLELHTYPLLWHYAHAAGYQTALISSQSYAWNNLEGFFVDAALDHVFTLERSDAEIVNSEGMDDRVMMDNALLTIERFAAAGPFFVALQFNCTHYPGYSPPASRMWSEHDGDRIARYDNSILYMDHLVGRLFDHLEESGLDENTIVLFASDHGEDVDGVRAIHRTDSYYQSAIHTPLVFVIPEKQRRRLGPGFEQLRNNAGTRVALSDLVPTVVDLMGIRDEARVSAWLGKLDGASLLTPVEPDRLLVAVNTDEHVRWSRTGYAVIAGKRKYIYYSWAGAMLFDLAADPREEVNLLAHGEALSSRHKKFLRRVQELVARTPSLRDIGPAPAH